MRGFCRLRTAVNTEFKQVQSMNQAVENMVQYKDPDHFSTPHRRTTSVLLKKNDNFPDQKESETSIPERASITIKVNDIQDDDDKLVKAHMLSPVLEENNTLVNETVDLTKCKDRDGNWTIWVLERLNDE